MLHHCRLSFKSTNPYTRQGTTSLLYRMLNMIGIFYGNYIELSPYCYFHFSKLWNWCLLFWTCYFCKKVRKPVKSFCTLYIIAGTQIVRNLTVNTNIWFIVTNNFLYILSAFLFVYLSVCVFMIYHENSYLSATEIYLYET